MTLNPDDVCWEHLKISRKAHVERKDPTSVAAVDRQMDQLAGEIAADQDRMDAVKDKYATEIQNRANPPPVP